MDRDRTEAELLRTVLNASLNGVMAFVSVREGSRIVDFRWKFVNAAAAAMVGRTPDELVGLRLLEEMPTVREEGLFDDYVRVVERSEPFQVVTEFHHPSTTGFPRSWVQLSAVPCGDGFVVTFADITTERVTLGHLADTEEELRYLVENANDLVTIHTAEGICEYASPASERLIGWSVGELLGRNGFDLVHPDDREHVWTSYAALGGTPHQAITVRHRIQKKDGDYTWIETTSQVGDDGRTISVGRDVTQTVALERELEALIRTDPLTQLANRRGLMERAVAAVGRALRYGLPLSLVALDIDYFKRINDTHGHEAGDQCLQALGEVLASSCRETDLAARTGGEEFVVLLDCTSLKGAQVFAARLQDRIRALQVPLDGATVSLTASIGVAELAGGEPTIEGVLRAADRALYVAKGNGRDRIVTAPEAMELSSDSSDPTSRTSSGEGSPPREGA